MSIFGISLTQPVTALANAVTGGESTTSGGGGLPFGTQSVMAGGMTAQPGGGANILKRMLIGGAAGAALGFGASFFTLPIIGQVAAPIAAAVGGGIGAVLGLASGLLANRNARIAQQQQAAAEAAANVPAAATPPVSIPKPPTGRTYKPGSQSNDVRWTQKELTRLGLYRGKVTGKLDKATANAIRRYEIMKGAMPTGNSSPDLRQALAQDVNIEAQLVPK
jgi:hypothetical protein